ncbi:putative ATP-dependent RNA helicase dhr2 [Xylographa carneopallida]|nr:putative ATP-dependent RNA helicase dhr2 [Xylographa carneopallida]
MPERVHHRFEDDPPPAKKIKTSAVVEQYRPVPEESASENLRSTERIRTLKTHSESRNGRVYRPNVQPPRGNSSLKDKANALLRFRKELPIWSHSEEIRQSLKSKDVLLLVGETGSGKSTQVPQFLIDEPWCKPHSVMISEDEKQQNVKVGGCIAITEPRRVAAITLARRVAEEMGTSLGSSSPASKVGYSVRFDNSTSPSTRIKFLTEGMLLQEMLRDPWLRQYSAVIVDEVHERGINVDLVMGFLKNIVSGKKEGRGGVPLKVAVMSATADLEGLQKFFDDKHDWSINRESPKDNEKMDNVPTNKTADTEDIESEWSGFDSDGDEETNSPDQESNHHTGKKTLTKNTSNGNGKLNGLQAKDNPVGEPPSSSPPHEKPPQSSPHVSVCHISGRQHPVQTIYSPHPVPDFVDAALRTIFQIHYKEPLPGDILVFLTGQETVETLELLVREYALALPPTVPKLLILPLFAALPQPAQQLVFQPTPAKTRKVILATNIAETSVTVAGVRFVVDSGKSKIKQFRTRLGLDSLLVKPISRSAATQRQGRAGRGAPGKCYRLYTEQDYLALAPAPTPEILRCDLSQALLTLKARGVDDVLAFPFLDRPPREALEKALLQLFQLGALTESGRINELGLQMARLPLTAPLGRVLLAAADPAMDCLTEAIDIIACLSVENIFLALTSEETKEQAENARRALFRREGDHLTLLATVRAYAAEKADRKAWAERHFVSHRAMQAVMVRSPFPRFPFLAIPLSLPLLYPKLFRPLTPSLSLQDVRKQLLAQTAHLSHPPPTLPTFSTLPTPTSPSSSPLTNPQPLSTTILKSFLRGFAPNTARLFPNGSYRTLAGNHAVAIHPSSGLFGQRVEAIMYHEFVFTNRSYARGVSAVRMEWVGEVVGV